MEVLMLRTRIRVARRTSRATITFLALAAAAAALALVAWPASAAVRTWVATNGNWSTAANWSGGLVPTAADDVGILGASGLSSRSVTYDYTGAPVTLLFLRLDASIA